MCNNFQLHKPISAPLTATGVRDDHCDDDQASQPMNPRFVTKVRAAVSLTVGGLVLASCCCPPMPCGLRGAAEKGESGQQREETVPDSGSRSLVLQFPNPLPVVPRDQEGFYSCWATSAEMIMEFIGAVRVRQCVQADRPFYVSLCCDGNGDLTRDPDCDSPNLPEFGRWGYDYRYRFEQALDWNGVRNEIDGGRPFAFAWTRTDLDTGASLAISHMMVVIGYNEGGGERAVLCLNPRPFAHTDHLLVPLAEYVGRTPAAMAAPSGLYIHEHDFFMINPSP